MRTLLVTLSLGLFYACTTEREIQATMMDVNLVKIDVVDRYPDYQQKMLTWRGTDNVLYITFEPLDFHLPLGTSNRVLVRR